jgi:hypothetical protein
MCAHPFAANSLMIGANVSGSHVSRGYFQSYANLPDICHSNSSCGSAL